LGLRPKIVCYIPGKLVELALRLIRQASQHLVREPEFGTAMLTYGNSPVTQIALRLWFEAEAPEHLKDPS
jgi:hypothetical protein